VLVDELLERHDQRPFLDPAERGGKKAMRVTKKNTSRAKYNNALDVALNVRVKLLRHQLALNQAVQLDVLVFLFREDKQKKAHIKKHPSWPTRTSRSVKIVARAFV
jgi:hypothetical protein